MSLQSILYKTLVGCVLASTALFAAGQAKAAPYHDAAVRACSSGTCEVAFRKIPAGKQLRVEHVSCLLEQIPNDTQMLWGQLSASATKKGVPASRQWLAAPAAAERSPDIVINQPTLFFVPQSQFPRMTVSLSQTFQSMSCTITGYLISAS